MSAVPLPAVGVVGLGHMGGAIAERLLAYGFAVRGFDVRPEAVRRLLSDGLIEARSPAEAAAESGVVLLSLPSTSASLESVMGTAGVLAAAHTGLVLVETSTVEVRHVRRLADECSQRGVAFLDAAVTGTAARAREGRLHLIVGGAIDNVSACEPVFGVIASRVSHVGPRPGAGMMVKLVNQLLGFVNIVAGLEALVLAARAGRELDVDLSTVYDVVAESSGGSAVWRDIIGRLLEGKAIGAGMTVLHKDPSLAVALAREFDVPVPVLDAALAEISEWKRLGLAEEDLLEVVHHLQQEFGLALSGSRTE